MEQSGAVRTRSRTRAPGAMTGDRTSGGTTATVAAMMATLGLAAASWVVAVRQMNGMDMGRLDPARSVRVLYRPVGVDDGSVEHCHAAKKRPRAAR